jgi:hypothetical protein
MYTQGILANRENISTQEGISTLLSIEKRHAMESLIFLTENKDIKSRPGPVQTEVIKINTPTATKQLVPWQ